MIKLWYVILSVISNITHDIKASFDSFARPKELINLLFWVMLIEIITGRYYYASITVALIIAAYVWKIIKQGDHNKMMKDRLNNSK